MERPDAADTFFANRMFSYLLREPHAIHSFELTAVREELQNIHHCFTGASTPAAIAPESPDLIIVPGYITDIVQEVFRFLQENRGRWACPSHREVVEMYGGGDSVYDAGDQLLLEAVEFVNARYRRAVNPNDRFVFLFRRFNGARVLQIRDVAGRGACVLNITLDERQREMPQILQFVRSLESAFRGLVPVPDRFSEYSEASLRETQTGLTLQGSRAVPDLWVSFLGL